MLSRTFYFILPILFFAQCKNTQSTCEQTMCTMEFRFVNVSIKDNSGKLFIADKVETYSDNGQLIHAQSSPTISVDTNYTVVDDNQLKMLQRGVDNILLFKVYKGTNVVYQSKYIITADCCHITKKSGESVIVIY